MAELLPEVTWGWRAAGLMLSVLISWAILVFIETPLRRKRLVRSNRAFLGGVICITIALLTVSAQGWRSAGAPERFAPEVLSLLEYRRDGAREFRPCDWPVRSCPIGPEGTPRLALVGDSHAWAFATGVGQWLREVDVPGQLTFASGCMPVPGLGDARCADFAEIAISALEADPDIQTVVLASIWRQASQESGLMVRGRHRTGQAAYDGFAAELAATVTRLRAVGKTVVVLEPFYAAPRHVPQTLARNAAFGRDWSVDTPLAHHREQFSKLEPGFEAAVAAGGYRMSLIDGLCASGICPGLVEGTPLFLDTNHLRLGQSDLITDIFATSFPPEAIP